MKRGFTLIELLVTVLIIAILAGIALPMYQKSVQRSKYSTLMSLVNSMANASENYYLTHGVYAENFDDLDVSVPSGGTRGDINGMDLITYDWGFCNLGMQNNLMCANTQQINNNYQYYYKSGASGTKGFVCIAYTTDVTDRFNRICQSFSGRETPSITAASCRIPPNAVISCNVYKM